LSAACAAKKTAPVGRFKENGARAREASSTRYRSSRSSITLPIQWYNLSFLQHPRRIIEFYEIMIT
jgi:hypothetical protein